MKKWWQNKKFLNEMLIIAIPIAIQNLITSSLNMVDTLMISGVGESSIAAVGLANQLFFFYSLILFGINSGSSIFISQYWGKKDTDSIRKILGLALTLNIVIGIIFTYLGFFKPEFIMGLLTPDKEVIMLGKEYLRIVSLSYIVTGITFAYGVASRSIGEARIPMIVSGVSFIINTVFNYLLIFGKFGFPELGIAGAAYGTLIARLVEVIAIILLIYKYVDPLAARLKELTNWSKEFFFRYIKTTYPVIINEGFWGLGQIMYSVAYARIGIEATAAVQIISSIQNIFMVLVRGLSNSCTVMVGNKIGGGKEEEAVEYSKQFLSMAVTIGLISGVILILFPQITLIPFRNIDKDLFQLSREMVRIMGIFFAFKTFNTVLTVGVLRGGGDTSFSMFLELGTMWLVGVPLAFIGAVVLKLPVTTVAILVGADDLLKSIIGFPRVKSGKWLKDVT